MVTETKSSARSAFPEETRNTDPASCKAASKNGQPCGGRARESGFCFAHDPTLSAERESARVRGGKNSSRRARLEKLMPEPLRPVFWQLEKAITDVYEDRLAPQKASAMASLVGAMVKVLNAGERTSTRSLTQLEFPGIEA